MKKILAIVAIMVLALSVFAVTQKTGNQFIDLSVEAIEETLASEGTDPMFHVTATSIILFIPLGYDMYPFLMLDDITQDVKDVWDIMSMYLIIVNVSSGVVYVPLDDILIDRTPVVLGVSGKTLVEDIYVRAGESKFYLLSTVNKTRFPTITWEGVEYCSIDSPFYLRLRAKLGL